MAKSINQVILLGNLTRDPEVRTTTSGKTITSFGIAVGRQGSDGVDFFDVDAWEKLGELVSQYFSKGSKVVVQGRLQFQQWDNKETGKKSSKVSITATDVTFLNTQSGESQERSRPMTQHEALGGANQRSNDQEDDKPIDLSEIPF